MFRAVWGSMLGLRGVKTHNPPSFLILWRLKGRQKLKFPRQPYSFSGGTGTKTHGTQKRGVYTRNCLPISASYPKLLGVLSNFSTCHGHIIIFSGVETRRRAVYDLNNVSGRLCDGLDICIALTLSLASTETYWNVGTGLGRWNGFKKHYLPMAIGKKYVVIYIYINI